MSKVSPVVSKAISSRWGSATYRDRVTKMPQDKRIGKIKKFGDHRDDVEEKTGMVKCQKQGGGQVEERRQRK